MNGHTIKEHFYNEFEVYGNLDVEIVGIKTNSKKIEKGDLFVAIKSERNDGHNFIGEAIKNGAVGVVVDRVVELPKDVLVIVAKDTRVANAVLSSFFFKDPSKKLKVVGITGTMGKTTIAYLLYRLFNFVSVPSSFIGTIGIGVKEHFEQKDLEPPTTPFPFELNKYLSDMVDAGVKYVFMEVSSHGIKDKRVYGIDFYKKILATMGEDHLDFHGTFEDYLNTKVSFFRGAYAPILNRDSPYIERFIEVSNYPVFYGRSKENDYSFSNIESGLDFIKFEVFEKGSYLGNVHLSLPSEFNAVNFMAVLSMARLEGIDFDKIRDFGKTAKIPGRMDLIEAKGRLIVIDYAHNPNEIEHVLTSLRKRTSGSLIVVFGAVGTSTRDKRIKMGETVSKLADFCILTTDDPRGHEVSPLIEDIELGVSIPHKVIIDRKAAIKYAILNSKASDTIAILGRGVEEKMRLPNNEVLRFRDEDVVKEVVNEI